MNNSQVPGWNVLPEGCFIHSIRSTFNDIFALPCACLKISDSADFHAGLIISPCVYVARIRLDYYSKCEFFPFKSHQVTGECRTRNSRIMMLGLSKLTKNVLIIIYRRNTYLQTLWVPTTSIWLLLYYPFCF